MFTLCRKNNNTNFSGLSIMINNFENGWKIGTIFDPLKARHGSNIGFLVQRFRDYSAYTFISFVYIRVEENVLRETCSDVTGTTHKNF